MVISFATPSEFGNPIHTPCQVNDMKSMQHRSIVPVLATLFLVSCSGEVETRSNEKTPELIIGGNDASAQAASIYQMPTPNELFSIVRELDGSGNKSALSGVPNADRFATLNGRALNFGVYATDMVYASKFNIKSEVVRYYLACKKLGDQLGLANSFNGEVQQRLEKNLTHGDSLDVLTNEAYYGAYQKLQEENMGPTLALVLAGGWIETMHLVMDKVEVYSDKDPLIARIAEQKASLEQLIDIMDALKDDGNVAQIRASLTSIRDIYDQLNVVRTRNSGTSASGRMVLGDDVSVSITAEKFVELKAAVEALRTTITRAEDTTGSGKNT